MVGVLGVEESPRFEAFATTIAAPVCALWFGHFPSRSSCGAQNFALRRKSRKRTNEAN